jgi:hypothetical protein
MPEIERQIGELTRLLEDRAGPLPALCKLVFDGYREYGVGEAEEDEEPPFRLLCPPASPAAVDAAERQLGFPLPPLLRAVYTRLGNGGYCLRLIGLDGGQGGYDDLGLPDESIVAGHRSLAGAWPEVAGGAWPAHPVPIDDGCGCGMIDCVDCSTPEGAIWRSDAGELRRRLPSLHDYLVEAIGRCDLAQKERD